MLRNQLKVFLESHGNLEVIGEAEDGLSGLRLVEALRPQLVIMDLVLRELTAMQIIPRLRRSCPDCGIIVYSINDAKLLQDAYQDAYHDDSTYFVSKAEPLANLVDVIHAIA